VIRVGAGTPGEGRGKAGTPGEGVWHAKPAIKAAQRRKYVKYAKANAQLKSEVLVR